MKPVHVFNVIPALPPQLEGLRRLAYNLRWSWDHNTINLFRRLDSDLWESTGHNPVRMLGALSQEQLDYAAKDESLRAHLERTVGELDAYLSSASTWYHRTYTKLDALSIAYFSAEFGLTECLSIFAGGLGVLAGDHLKSASDLGLPMIGVGLLYQQGYFSQYLDTAGWQQETYEENDFENLPLKLQMGADGKPATVEVAYDSRRIFASIWRADVGRVPLYLLDTNIPENSPEDRDLTDQLYGGDREMRLRQEILLGIGGYRALEVLGVEPTVYHMNEGHSAFLSLERTRNLMRKHGLSFAEARGVAQAELVFTGHTPVPAGHDYFSPGLIDRYLGRYAGELGLSRNEFLGLGRQDPANEREDFCMTVLALRMAGSSNGVSKLHGSVSREMWKAIWAGIPVAEIPIGQVTNGVHFRSWISHEMNQLYDRYLGPGWREEHGEPKYWRRAEQIPAGELWRTHELRRERLVAFARRRLIVQLQRRGAPPSAVDTAEEALDPDALTIGFARRFATYKRATLLLRDVDRLARILNQPGRPVQVLYAGKAHPRDDAGKALIQQIVQVAQRPEFRRRLVFLEDYDMAVARYMVQGCDIWLNTPLRPLEASGTSGMKALANGGLNLSIPDGWWDEAWHAARERNTFAGWAIGRGESYQNAEYQDQVESAALYDLLEHEIVPAFYERGADGLPRRWVANMKSSIAALCPTYNTQRMLTQYMLEFYAVAHERYRALISGKAERARELAAWLARIQREWAGVRVEAVSGLANRHMYVGEDLTIEARIRLGEIEPDEVAVELYFGSLNASGEIVSGVAIPMQHVAKPQPGISVFRAERVRSRKSGRHGYTVRVLPYHPDEARTLIPGLIRWADAGVGAAAN
jgi:starch phosphorylase